MKNRLLVWAYALLIATAAPAAAVAGGAAAKVAPSLPCVAALIKHESHEVRNDGLSTDSRYQERMYRCGTRVWIERVLPPSAAATTMGQTNGHGHEGHGREELPALTSLPLVVSRGHDGNVAVELVWAAKQLRVLVQRSEFETVGFSGNFEQSALIVDQATLSGLLKGATADGAVSYAGKRGNSSLRIWWSPKWQLPIKIEVRAPNGMLVQRTSLDLRPINESEAPWTKITNWPRKEYTDFLD